MMKGAESSHMMKLILSKGDMVPPVIMKLHCQKSLLNVFMVTLSFDNSIYVEILLSLGVKIASSNNIQCIRIK